MDNLLTLGYQSMTAIQAQSLPAILAAKDVIAQGKTGSGKTAAFALGILHRLKVKQFRVQSLVLCPTRELADQVAKEIRRVGRGIHNIKVLTLSGGVPLGPQIGSLEHGAHVIVGTPGRIEDHLRKERLNLDHLTTLVLDEADRMLEMGFQPALDLIFAKCPAQRQTLLFSATFPPQIKSITHHIMTDPITVKVEDRVDNSNINQHFYQLPDKSKRLQALQLLLLQFAPQSSVVFCNTKIETENVANALRQQGFNCLALHGDLEQKDRDRTLAQFSGKSVSVLVATDVAARGLDIENLDAVFNYELSRDPEVHVHRIGRTGRAGSQGVACSLVCDNDVHRIIKLEDYMNTSIEMSPLPDASVLSKSPLRPSMITLQIEGGKKQKVRPGDILGALTSDKGESTQPINGDQVGKIQIFDQSAYVAIKREVANKAIKKLSRGKIKGRTFKVRLVNSQ